MSILTTLLFSLKIAHVWAAGEECNVSLSSLGFEFYSPMTFSQQATLTSTLELSPYITFDCSTAIELSVTPPVKYEGCFEIPAGTTEGEYVLNSMNATFTSNRGMEPGYDTPQ